jgi:hypothetical protein
MELAGIASTPIEHANDLAAQRAHLVVGVVGFEHERLLGINPENQIPE